MTTALLAIAPRISYRALLIIFFIAAYPLRHADFPAVSVEHVDVVPALIIPESMPAPAVQSVPVPQERLGHCRG